ncbi:hypothetical protein KPH14_001506 [Odynerus spinipes]|uniref:Ribonuclease H1 n=1 Tax=Odynerus spinipes TaxID=1348599 RepID=A0AAD9VU86_9HYME|nr:hypothetical protein KPH14_001506 [Odynerus spinipes]
MPSFYYAVAKGRKPGVYHSWPECQAQIHQFSGSIFKKFSSKSEADNFIKSNNNFSNVSSSTPSSKKSTSFLKTNRSASTSPQEKKLLKRMIAIELKNTEAKTKKRKLESENETEPVKIAKQNACDTSSQNTSYIIDKDGYVNVYTDGACSSNGTRGARAGLGVWFGDNHPSNVSEAVLGRATNNMAEIQAVTRAAEQAKNAGITKLKINTDSQFLISCITQWMPKWKKNGWQTASKQPVINKTELLEMEKALKSLDVVWNHVNGHVGIYGNEMADKLAREGCQHYKQLSKR